MINSNCGLNPAMKFDQNRPETVWFFFLEKITKFQKSKTCCMYFTLISMDNDYFISCLVVRTISDCFLSEIFRMFKYFSIFEFFSPNLRTLMIYQCNIFDYQIGWIYTNMFALWQDQQMCLYDNFITHCIKYNVYVYASTLVIFCSHNHDIKHYKLIFKCSKTIYLKIGLVVTLYGNYRTN